VVNWSEGSASIELAQVQVLALTLIISLVSNLLSRISLIRYLFCLCCCAFSVECHTLSFMWNVDNVAFVRKVVICMTSFYASD
jgi:hypothetical protein